MMARPLRVSANSRVLADAAVTTRIRQPFNSCVSFVPCFALGPRGAGSTAVPVRTDEQPEPATADPPHVNTETGKLSFLWHRVSRTNECLTCSRKTGSQIDTHQ